MANPEPVKPHLTKYNTYNIWDIFSQIILFDQIAEAEGSQVDLVKLYLTGKIKRKVLACLIKYKATYIKEIQRETGESKQIIDYHLLQWVKHGGVKQYPVEDLKYRGNLYIIFACEDTDEDTIVEANLRLKRELAAEKIGPHVIEEIKLAPEIAQEISRRYGLKPSHEEIIHMIREYGVRGNSVPFIEREVYLSLKQLMRAI